MAWLLLTSLLLWGSAAPYLLVDNYGQQAALNDQESKQSTATAGERSFVRKSAEGQRFRKGSTRHFAIPGVLTLRGGAREAVIMHIYLRSQQKGSAVVFRGFMFAESVERDWYSLFNGYVCQPDVPQEAWPGITLREVGGKREHRLRVYSELIFGHEADKPAVGTKNYNRTCMPYPFMGELTVDEAASDLWIAIDGFKKTARLTPAKPQLPQASVWLPLKAGQTNKTVLHASMVLYPFTLSTNAEVAADLLLQHVSYHLQLGFAKVIQYTQASFLAAFLADERLKAFLRGGQLELVLWDHLGECIGPPHMRCWQPLVYSHAILEAWGCNNYLLISDIDEYFVLPMEDTTLAGALSDCTEDGKPMARPPVWSILQVKVERYNVFLTPEAVALLPKGEPEVGLWRLRGRGAKHAEHPLKLYGIRSVGPIKLGKGLVVPERIAAYEVHNGVVFTRNPDKTLFWMDQKAAKTTLNEDCGHLVHLNNLFKSRSRPDDYPSAPDTSWHWVFGPVVKPVS